MKKMSVAGGHYINNKLLPPPMNIQKRNSVENLFMFIIGLILAAWYISNIKNICTIWELNDEAQFLFNGSLLAGYDWTEVFSNMTAYYGYGYSLLLIPLFALCDSGLTLIRGAISVNIACIILLYFVQIYVMEKIFLDCNKNILAIMSAFVCLQPYLVASSMKTICESFLTLQTWIVALLLYKVSITNKSVYYIMFSISVAFTFFIHTRGIATMGAAGLVFFMFLLKGTTNERKNNLKKTVISIIIFIITVVAFFYIKKNIMKILGTGILIKKTTEVDNIVTSSFLIDRIKWILTPENLSIYFHCAVGKLFYLIVSTAGIIIFGIIESIVYIKGKIKQNQNLTKSSDYLQYFFIIQFILILVICIVAGTGETYAFYIYGRYYEHTVGFMIFLGLYAITRGNYCWKKLLGIVFCVSLMGIITAHLRSFAQTNFVEIDTSRYAGITYAIYKNGSWTTTIFYLTLITIGFSFIYVLLRNKNEKKILIFILIFAWVICSDSAVLRKINEVQAYNKADMIMAEYIEKKLGDKEIYFIYEKYKYDSYFSRMQVFLKNKTIHVIEPESYYKINEPAFIITYKNSKFTRALKNSSKQNCIMTSTNYNLFSKK